MDTVLVRRRGGAAIIELHRPDALNAWDRAMAEDLRAALEEAENDDEIRAICITGAGRGFSSGADLRDVTADLTAEGHIDFERSLTERYHPIIAAIRRMPKPVVAAVNGAAAGVGASLALACDLVIAKESAYFLLAFVNIGLVPDGGSSFLVPERVGFTRAAEMMLLGERVPAPLAAEWGLINRSIPDGDFASETDALVDRLAAGPTRAYAGIKRQLEAWLYGRMDDQLRLEASSQQEMGRTADFAEGVQAFLAKRAASFRGA